MHRQHAGGTQTVQDGVDVRVKDVKAADGLARLKDRAFETQLVLQGLHVGEIPDLNCPHGHAVDDCRRPGLEGRHEDIHLVPLQGQVLRQLLDVVPCPSDVNVRGVFERIDADSHDFIRVLIPSSMLHSGSQPV